MYIFIDINMIIKHEVNLNFQLPQYQQNSIAMYKRF